MIQRIGTGIRWGERMETIYCPTFAFRFNINEFVKWYKDIYDCGDSGDIIEWKEKTEAIKGYVGLYPAAFDYHYVLFVTKKGRDEGAKLAKEYGIKQIEKLDTPRWIDVQRILEVKRGCDNERQMD